MDVRNQLRSTLAFDPRIVPPRFESEFSDGVIRSWREQGLLSAQETPEAHFGLDERTRAPAEWCRLPPKRFVVTDTSDLPAFRAAYDPHDPERHPSGPHAPKVAVENRPCYVTPWNEGFLQVLGIGDAESLRTALTVLCERPSLAEAQMEHYAWFLEDLLDRALGEVDADYAVFYEPIASRHGPVIGPDQYNRFVIPALRRVVDRLDRHGVAHRFVWTSGRIYRLLPHWLDAGITGLMLNHASATGLAYPALRKRFPNLRLMGGVDWRALMRGSEAIDDELTRNVLPLVQAGGYIPHLDDTVREYIGFEQYRYYRIQLNKLLTDVCGDQRPTVD